MLTVKDIYRVIDTHAPFASQESWDNSGLLVGAMEMPVSRVLIALDISEEVIKAAQRYCAQLIVAHHPVIFSPLKTLCRNHPVYQLAAGDIAAICVHTPLDIAPDGLNAYAHTLLKERLLLEDHAVVLEPAWTDGRGFGWIDTSSRDWTAAELAEELRNIFACTTLRYSNAERTIRKIAYCSGSAASMLESAAEQGCDAMITGDIKHDRWYAAEFDGMALFDCGHFETERFAVQILADWLAEAFPCLSVLPYAEKNPAAVCTAGGVA